MVNWVWDPRKAVANKHKHGISFDAAKLVFRDPFLLSTPDPHESDDRWRSLGCVGGVTIFVVHTVPEANAVGETVGRLISARKATSREREAYENGE